MYKSVASIGTSTMLFFGILCASAALAEATSCLDEDRGYGLIRADRTIDPVRYYGLAVKKVSASSLNGKTISRLPSLGVTTGDPREWARLFTMMCKQESGCRLAEVNSNGTLAKFRGTLAGECSYGPLQFCINQYGLTSWAMVNSPSCTLDAVIRVAERGLLFEYFGPLKRGGGEVMQHASWFNRTVQPFADALKLVFDPNAPNIRAYEAVTPFFTNPYKSTPFGPGAGLGLGSTGLAGIPSALGTPTLGATAGTGGAVASQGTVQAPALGGTQTASSVVQSALLLIVQPSSTTVGRRALVSWTSVGMRSAETDNCRVIFDDIGVADGGPFAFGNSGTKEWIATKGEHTFQLICMPLDGSPVRESSQTIVVP